MYGIPMDVNKTFKETAKARQEEFVDVYERISVLERNLREFKKRIKHVCDAAPETYVARGMVSHDVKDLRYQVQNIMEVVERIENKNFAMELLMDIQKGDE